MTLRELVNKYPKGLDWEIVVSEDCMLLESKPIRRTSFGVSGDETRIYLIYE